MELTVKKTFQILIFFVFIFQLQSCSLNPIWGLVGQSPEDTDEQTELLSVIALQPKPTTTKPLNFTGTLSFDGLQSGNTVSNTEILLSWNSATDTELASSQISYEICDGSTTGACNSNFITSYTSAKGVNSYNVTGLISNSKHFFKVRAVKGNGDFDSNVVEKSAVTYPPNGGVFNGEITYNTVSLNASNMSVATVGASSLVTIDLGFNIYSSCGGCVVVTGVGLVDQNDVSLGYKFCAYNGNPIAITGPGDVASTNTSFTAPAVSGTYYIRVHRRLAFDCNVWSDQGITSTIGTIIVP